MVKPDFHDAHSVIPIVVLAYVTQGVFALTSVGIGISKQTMYYPVMTLSAALANIILNILWIPRFGIEGAAWATVVGYGLMAVMGIYFGNKHYPIPYEWSRLARIAAAAALAYAVSTLAGDAWQTAIPLKLAATLVFPAALAALGFFRHDEIAWLKERLATWCFRN